MNSKISWPIVGVAALLLLVAACSGDDESESQDQRPADPVVEYYDALNTEDVEGVLVAWPSADQAVIEVETSALHVKTSATCAPGDDPDSMVQCDEDIGRHDFYIPAGISGHVTVLFTIEDGVIVAREMQSSRVAIEDYEAAFGAWLEATHPDVYASSYQTDGPYPFATAEQALEVIALVDEFLAQSGVYPLES